ncbi:CapA family protein [Streptomyces griseoloalbus]|uniref:Poly-gamma-glutamate synthesis protein (Capsule biosynthesis protein) n=1 Tax=Streptomyces griseoloalbus TaxID=67303 RepID=A0A7W8BIR9_9ACTN|nr:CapA family protein [Streptomyces albaduncus]MBB5124117.1 poly-gamma-glutamate synthesis protein (capsule biosynthesis protein) [Streptomyces albaduncus]GGV84044.1 poly-gamma-glutamate biosynthesis protein [Streptomyces griseoloalbus]GGW32691.1 poly-gamma-glutamate biosynthesis protein [Streptomyces albaduncus]
MGRTVTILAAVSLTAACGSEVAEPQAKPGGRSFTVAAAGDILIHPELVEQAAKDAERTGKGEAGLDFGPLLAGVKPVISKADLAICHMETPVGKPEGPFEGYPEFLVPPQILTAVKDVGYDTCSTASNHTYDHGMKGVRNTLEAMDEVGLGHTGSARTPEEAKKINIRDVNGVKVAHLSYSWESFLNPTPENRSWAFNRSSTEEIKAAESRARQQGADVVILSVHWGLEHYNEPSVPQLEMAQRITEETGVDLVIGHHAHVVQPIQKVNGTWIAYSLGNQVARHSSPTGLTEEGAIGWFEFREAAEGWDVTARYRTTLVDIPPETEAGEELPDGAVEDHRLVDVQDRLDHPDGLSDERLARYRLAADRTRGFLYNRGAPGGDGLEPLTLGE